MQLLVLIDLLEVLGAQSLLHHEMSLLFGHHVRQVHSLLCRHVEQGLQNICLGSLLLLLQLKFSARRALLSRAQCLPVLTSRIVLTAVVFVGNEVCVVGVPAIPL